MEREAELAFLTGPEREWQDPHLICLRGFLGSTSDLAIPHGSHYKSSNEGSISHNVQ